jgi:uncharacterized protein with ParB-like and HNH nuclease domain
MEAFDRINIANQIKVASCTISDLFLENIVTESGETISGNLEIPEYQRPYVWQENQIKKLLTDIKEHFESSDTPLYYLGSIILHQHDNTLSIIDGQQRLTTLAIIQHIKDINKVPKLKYASPKTITNIKNNYNYLNSKKDELRNIDFEKLNVTIVVTDNEDDAYTFFETQNTGGVRLLGIDIIKAHHLRAIPHKERNENYAITWEKQKNIDTVIKQLIKARRWNVLNPKYVPSDRDEKGTKNSIIEDFSEETKGTDKIAYSQIMATNNYSLIQVSPYKLAIRQPLANGENFIDYLEQFCDLYQRLFKNVSDAEISGEYYSFNQEIIQPINGTAFLKEFYEIALLCYVNKFGFEKLVEASYWIFRYTYSLRITSLRVMEKSIPAFIKNNHWLFDSVLSSFNSKEAIERLKAFDYSKFILTPEEIQKSGVTQGFIKRISEYFQGIDKSNFDKTLKIGIYNKIKDANNGK